MSMSPVSEALGIDTEEEQKIIDFLKLHPDFFEGQPELLAQMRINHECGGAVSFIEHQVVTLREQNHRLKNKMKLLINNARENEELSQRMHALTIDLMDGKKLDQVLSLLYAALQDDFGAEHVTIRLLGKPLNEADAGLAEFSPDVEAIQGIIDRVKEAEHPICGRLNIEHKNLLFVEDIEHVNSGALLALGSRDAIGVLAIGSADESRYHPGMGTLFIRNLADIAERALKRFIS